MNWKIKASIISTIIIIICVLAFIIKKQNDTIKELKAVQTHMVEMKSMADGSIRSESTYASKKDIEDAIKEAGFDAKIIKNDISNLNSDLKGIHTIVSKSTGTKIIHAPSTHIEPNNNPIPDVVECTDGTTVECPDQFGYKTNKQVLQLNEPFGDNVIVPIGEVSFSAWKDRPWEVYLHPRNYHVNSIVSTDEDGQHTFYNRFSIETNGNTYEVPIYNSRFIQKYPKNSFRFDPKIYLGIDSGILIPSNNFEFTPNVQIGLFSYGKTKKDIDFSFLLIGPGYNVTSKSPSLILTPISYNLGKHIPLIDNLLIGPSLSYDTGSNYGIMFGVKTVF